MIEVNLEKKYISKENWKRVIEREELYKSFNYEDLVGEVALIKIKKVKEPY